MKCKLNQIEFGTKTLKRKTLAICFFCFDKKKMGKKRKHSETEAAAPVEKNDSAPERPKRTLLGWKDKNEDAEKSKAVSAFVSGFRNKEKVLVTCSRRISFR